MQARRMKGSEGGGDKTNFLREIAHCGLTFNRSRRERLLRIKKDSQSFKTFSST